MSDQFKKGLATIRQTIEASLNDRKVADAQVDFQPATEQPQDVQGTVTVNGVVQTQTFTREEIEDSALAIDAPSAVKVRMLVGPFVR
jgi:hypothetical protein